MLDVVQNVTIKVSEDSIGTIYSQWIYSLIYLCL
jgi:hypothetical protein